MSSIDTVLQLVMGTLTVGALVTGVAIRIKHRVHRWKTDRFLRELREENDARYLASQSGNIRPAYPKDHLGRRAREQLARERKAIDVARDYRPVDDPMVALQRDLFYDPRSGDWRLTQEFEQDGVPMHRTERFTNLEDAYRSIHQAVNGVRAVSPADPRHPIEIEFSRPVTRADQIEAAVQAGWITPEDAKVWVEPR